MSIKPDDLRPVQLGPLKWNGGYATNGESLRAVYDHSTKHAERAINWYLESKRSKKWWALRLRIAAIIVAGIAGIIPMLLQVWGTAGQEKEWWAQPVWATIVLGFAGIIVLVDRLVGFSSAWMRFIEAEHEIRTALHEFHYDWEAIQVEAAGPLKTEAPSTGTGGEPPVDPCPALKLLRRAKLFVQQVDAIVKRDTQQWIAEFSKTIRQIDSMVKVREKEEGEKASGDFQ